MSMARHRHGHEHGGDRDHGVTQVSMVGPTVLGTAPHRDVNSGCVNRDRK